MSSKLTLSVDKPVIEKAKRYAKTQGKSLSNIVEEYLKSLTALQEQREEMEISPLVISLWGSVKGLPESKDYKEVIAEELVNKYFK